MPVKRRSAKRYLTPEAELFAWASVFDSEFDFFDDLPGIGIATDQYGRPDIETAREAWGRLGAMYIAAGGSGAWALAKFKKEILHGQ